MTEQLALALELAEEQGYHGLLYQHINLCPTRTWLHFHHIDCAHLNRYMQMGSSLHRTAYQGRLDNLWGLGIRPDSVDFVHHVVSEVKHSRSFVEASVLQLGFYLSVLTDATGVEWEGRLRYPALRKVRTVTLTNEIQQEIVLATYRIHQTVTLSKPPDKQNKPLCVACSYRLLCWGVGTEDQA